jgi:hypothetical protein
MAVKSNVVDRIMNSLIGSIIISVILGFGLACIFKQTCTGDQCVIIKSPPVDTTKIYGFDNKCYKYKSAASKCSAREN